MPRAGSHGRGSASSPGVRPEIQWCAMSSAPRPASRAAALLGADVAASACRPRLYCWLPLTLDRSRAYCLGSATAPTRAAAAMTWFRLQRPRYEARSAAAGSARTHYPQRPLRASHPAPQGRWIERCRLRRRGPARSRQHAPETVAPRVLRSSKPFGSIAVVALLWPRSSPAPALRASSAHHSRLQEEVRPQGHMRTRQAWERSTEKQKGPAEVGPLLGFPSRSPERSGAWTDRPARCDG